MERGEFDDLPGTGRPIRGLAEPHDDMWWVKAKMEREQISFLPPALALRKRRQEVLAAVSQARSEEEVRRLVEPLNEAIVDAIRTPPPGPALDVGPLDPERVLREWRASRGA